MTEKDYINATNLTRLMIARSLIAEFIYQDNEKEYFKKIIQELNYHIDGLHLDLANND